MRALEEIRRGLLHSYLFAVLSAEDLAVLARGATTRELARGEYAWRAGDPAEEIYVVLRGEVQDFVLDAEGRQVLHVVHGPGMTLGEPGYFSIERDRSVSSVAVLDSTLIRLDRRVFAPFLCAHPEVADRALEGLAAVVRWAGSVMASLATRPLAERVLLRLLQLVDSETERMTGRALTSEVSQSTLAAMAGVSRENVNRALAGLTADGLIRREGSRYLLLDAQRLRTDLARDWPVPVPLDRGRGRRAGV